MDIETWLKNLNKRVLLGSAIFAIAGLALVFFVTDSSLWNFLWYSIAVFVGVALAYFFFPVFLRQQFLISVGLVVLLALGVSFVVGAVSSLEQSQNLVFGIGLGWGIGSLQYFQKSQRSAEEVSGLKLRDHLVVLGYFGLFIVTLSLGIALSDLLF